MTVTETPDQLDLFKPGVMTLQPTEGHVDFGCQNVAFELDFGPLTTATKILARTALEAGVSHHALYPEVLRFLERDLKISRAHLLYSRLMLAYSKAIRETRQSRVLPTVGSKVLMKTWPNAPHLDEYTVVHAEPEYLGYIKVQHENGHVSVTARTSVTFKAVTR